ncbi:unnamed protein product [Protopolystoma xenopodis]|uniref:Uncharacterized protein n=1 Tax=Protopolystoma xenopodis TaxID=117903 RepID=A0A448WBT3_9PLAT|nr:unnamed protein product [Protopolystoma xenopodis]
MHPNWLKSTPQTESLNDLSNIIQSARGLGFIFILLQALHEVVLKTRCPFAFLDEPFVSWNGSNNCSAATNHKVFSHPGRSQPLRQSPAATVPSFRRCNSEHTHKRGLIFEDSHVSLLIANIEFKRPDFRVVATASSLEKRSGAHRLVINGRLTSRSGELEQLGYNGHATGPLQHTRACSCALLRIPLCLAVCVAIAAADLTNLPSGRGMEPSSNADSSNEFQCPLSSSNEALRKASTLERKRFTWRLSLKPPRDGKRGSTKKTGQSKVGEEKSVDENGRENDIISSQREKKRKNVFTRLITICHLRRLGAKRRQHSRCGGHTKTGFKKTLAERTKPSDPVWQRSNSPEFLEPELDKPIPMKEDLIQAASADFNESARLDSVPEVREVVNPPAASPSIACPGSEQANLRPRLSEIGEQDDVPSEPHVDHPTEPGSKHTSIAIATARAEFIGPLLHETVELFDSAPPDRVSVEQLKAMFDAKLNFPEETRSSTSWPENSKPLIQSAESEMPSTDFTQKPATTHDACVAMPTKMILTTISLPAYSAYSPLSGITSKPIMTSELSSTRTITSSIMTVPSAAIAGVATAAVAVVAKAALSDDETSTPSDPESLVLPIALETPPQDPTTAPPPYSPATEDAPTDSPKSEPVFPVGEPDFALLSQPLPMDAIVEAESTAQLSMPNEEETEHPVIPRENVIREELPEGK